MTALEIRGLHVSYGATLAVRGVSLSLASGEVLGIVGPNGSGKSTLLKAVSRVTRIARGDVRIGGGPAARMSRQALSRAVAVVPQAAALPAGYTVLDVVLMGRTPHLAYFAQETGEDLRQARAALARVGVLHLAERRVDEISGGERQCVVLARALAQATPVLLLDEPTASLDIGHQVSVLGLVRAAAGEQGVAVLAALHDLTLASLYCDRLVLLADGVVLAEGPPARVLTRENIAAAYGTAVTILHDPSLPGPVVVPAAPREAAAVHAGPQTCLREARW